MLRVSTFCLAFLGLSGPSLAADFSDPTWPCVQRKVADLSIGLMWAAPVTEISPDDKELRQEIKAMADVLAVRRIELESLRPKVVEFAARHNGDAQVLGLVFASVFDKLAKRRSRIINGIGDFSLSQISLSEKVENARREMEAELAVDAPDFDKVDALEEQIDWDQLIYTDRQQSITYLCETPTLLEKRLFGIAQMLQFEVQEG